MQVLGPMTVPAEVGVGLPWLGSVGESINGHSVVLLVRFGNVRFLLMRRPARPRRRRS